MLNEAFLFRHPSWLDVGLKNEKKKQKLEKWSATHYNIQRDLFFLGRFLIFLNNKGNYFFHPSWLACLSSLLGDIHVTCNNYVGAESTDGKKTAAKGIDIAKAISKSFFRL